MNLLNSMRGSVTVAREPHKLQEPGSIPGPATNRYWVLALLFLALILLSAGCTTTITPKVVTDSHASFDGNQANSGFIAFTADGSGLITPHARERYNSLIDRYGSRFVPPLGRNAGVRPDPSGNFIIDAEHLVKFATMNRWSKSRKIE